MSEWKETSLGKIPSDWDIVSLGDMLYIKGRIGWKGLKKSEYLNEGYAIINGEQIINGKIDWRNVGRITKERYEESPEIMLKKNDILLTKDGTIGKTAFIDNLPEPATVASGVFVIRKQSHCLIQRYLYYFFHSHYFDFLIKSRTEGSVVPHLYQRDFTEMEIPLPDSNEQKNISKFLTTIDSKIDLLRRQNETLERIAQALFKKWFVDYEFPDENGRPYKSSGGKMVPSKLGEVPEGWKVCTINDITSLIIDYRGKTPKKLGMNWSPRGIPALSAKNIKDGEIICKDSMYFGNKKLYKKWMKNELKKRDILLTSEAPLGEVFFLANDKKYILSQRLFSLRTNKKYQSSYLYYWLKSYKGQYLLNRRATGTTVVGIRQKELKQVEILIPKIIVLEKLNNILELYILKMDKNSDQIENLKELRDTLLPKLMSGKIRIPDK